MSTGVNFVNGKFRLYVIQGYGELYELTWPEKLDS